MDDQPEREGSLGQVPEAAMRPGSRCVRTAYSARPVRASKAQSSFAADPPLRSPGPSGGRSGGGHPMDRPGIIARLIEPEVVQLRPMSSARKRLALSLADHFIYESKESGLIGGLTGISAGTWYSALLRNSPKGKSVSALTHSSGSSRGLWLRSGKTAAPIACGGRWSMERPRSSSVRLTTSRAVKKSSAASGCGW